MPNRPFKQLGPTVTLSPTTSSVNSAILAGAPQVLVLNPSTSASIAYLRFSGTTGPVADTTDLPIPIGGWAVVTKDAAGFMAAICATGSATLLVTPGEGG